MIEETPEDEATETQDGSDEVEADTEEPKEVEDASGTDNETASDEAVES